jgi:hypothetical protein
MPGITVALDASRAHGAARYLASRMMFARAHATSHGATTALRFETMAGRMMVGVFVDGNRNGVRSVDIETGLDPSLGAPVAFADLFPGVALTMSDGAPSLFSFTPVGTASSGTVEVHGRGGARFAVRVLGVTARARVVRYVAARQEWVDAW